MEKSFTYREPLHPDVLPRTEENTWDKVIESHKQKDYRAVILGILDYVDLDLAARCGNADRSAFDIPHGSISLQMHLSDAEFQVKAPFLNIANSKKIPLMRKVTELNFSPLNLSTIKLEDDQLEFRYSCALELCEPYRTYDALREICIYADSYDDEFINKFNASWIRDPRIEHYSDELKELAWEHTREDLAAARESVAFFESKRAFNLAWDVIVITLMKIEHHVEAEGMLRTDLEKMISYMTASQDAMNDKVNRGKNFLTKLEDYQKADFMRDLYRSETFIPYKVRTTEQSFRSNSENAYGQAKKEIEQGNYIGAAMTLYYHFLYTFYHHYIPAEIKQSMQQALEKSSGQPWQESASILFTTLHEIMASDNGSGLTTDRHRGRRWGFMEKIFGRKK